QRLEQERKVMEQNLTRKLEDQYRIEMEMLRKQNESKSKELQVLRQQELVLREEKDRLEALRQTIDLEIQRKLDSERQSIVEKVRQQERQHLLSELNFQEESLSMLR